MERQSIHYRLIEDQGGLLLAPARAVLFGLSQIYKIGVDQRNGRFDRQGASSRLDAPVISVGNITAGGTGKTPLVIEIVHLLEQLGRTPAVVSRGYKAVPGEPNDEERLIRKHCPTVVCIQDPNRARGGNLAINKFGADAIVLDDGFQHRRLARDLDIVAIDATCPFGHDHLLPRGLLREPVSGLSRANIVVLTRCNQVAPAALTRIHVRVSKLSGDVPMIECSHRVTGVETLDGQSVAESLQGRRAVLFAGIGRPQAFLASAQMEGLNVVGEHWWPDHHRYTQRDIDSLFKPGRFPDHELLLTTEKDATKLTDLRINQGIVHVMRVAIDFHADGARILQDALTELVKEFAAA